MVAANTQVSPLQHHLKSSNTLQSIRNYSRIQSEVQREGFEVHKENLLSLSLSKNGKHSGAAEKDHAIISMSGSQVGHLHTQGASVKTGLPSASFTKMVPSLHEVTGQEQKHNTRHMDLKVLHDTNCLVAPHTAEDPSCIAVFSTSPALQSLVPGGEATNAYNLYAEMFPRACTPMSACAPTFNVHKEREFCPTQPMITEHLEVVQFVPDVKSVEDGRADNVKRLKYTSVMEDASKGLLDMQTSNQRNTSCYVVDESCVKATGDDAKQAGMSNACSVKWADKSNEYAVTIPTPQPNGFNAPSNMNWVSNANAYSACSSSPTAELSTALPVVGLKLFTTTAHAHMPNVLLTVSEGDPSLPLSLERIQQQASTRLQKTPMHENSCTDGDWGKFLALSATPVANNTETANARVLLFQQRFKQLQAFLKQRDETDQNECIQALRSLSAAARSGHAVELETRAIRLSLEEGKEIKRMRLLNVLGKVSERSDDAGATPQGPRLPAPGATARLKSVP